MQGALILGTATSQTPLKGTIRYDSISEDFQGWNGNKWISLTLGPCGGLTFVKAIDGNAYRIVAFGDQCWMADNLRTSHYRDTSSIPNVTVNGNWSMLLTPGFAWYDNDIGNKLVYGGLYNWFALDTASNGSKHICPSGWHIPSGQEFDRLIDRAGGQLVAGIELKETGLSHYLSDNLNSTNSTGFTAIPAGYRDQFGSFYEFGYYA